MLLLALAVAGAVGAPLRAVVDGAVSRRVPPGFPWGTFVVNVTASFAVGLVTGLALHHAFPDTPRTVLATGIGGAYSTWSTFVYESVRLAEEGDVRDAVLNLVVSVVSGTLAAGAGLALMATV